MDIIGKRFGRLTVLRREGDERPLRYRVVCSCDCGEEWSGYLYSLTTGYTKSCGCLKKELAIERNTGMQRHKDMIGQRYGRLTILSRAGTSAGRSAKWLCRCDCGTVKVIAANPMHSGLTRSCGCLQREKAKATMTKHGRYKDADYIRELGDKRRAMKANGFVEHVDPAVVYERDMGLCQICGLPVEDDFNMDHRIPLFLGGKHSYDNCQTSHASCNFKKARYMPEDCAHLWRRS